uniref:LIM zinc-binding domain-containing protein n=1 Tax=Panagrellus redivivus TaxID=6233 RepID=A0A7E4ULE6_PANRE
MFMRIHPHRTWRATGRSAVVSGNRQMVKQLCHRCTKPVYPTDKVGPLKDSTFFHNGCFKCYICGTRLALKTYCNNRNNIDDKEVYCNSHVPNPNPHDLPPLQRPNYTNGNDKKSDNNDKFALNAGLGDMKIAHAIKATQVTKPYPKIHHDGAKYVVDYDAQTRLELLHRQVEDDLYKTFDQNRQQELNHFEQETKEEWEKALAEFARKFEKGQGQKNNKDELIRQLTIKREKKLETITSKRKERERHQTAELVDRQAKEMLELFKQARIGGDGERIEDDGGYGSEIRGDPPSYPTTPPPPLPPSCSKRHIYTDTSVFEQIDQVAISVAQSEVATFTDLIRTLTAGARSDVDKARAIYRWITVKNLNVMVFDNDVDINTPMGLLRGIKYGTESYHVLFKRLCAYAGLHCVVIKGYSKSAGYQPGFRFDDSRFRNTWNAVFLDGSWRFVQCNWGARHIVNAKESTRQTSQNPKDGNLRYEYDDHYFMTDPEEFVYEFFPADSEWQLLPRPITLKQFENLPFVRSIFFRYGLRFTDSSLPAVIFADRTGAATISISMSPEAVDNLIFHYNLRFFEGDETEVNGMHLKRFVMQSMVGDAIVFRVHAPSTRPLLLDIFANAVSPGHYLTGQPIKFKSVCKFKIICENLNVIMVPLPECASGEWGPAKAFRLFGLLPLTHEEAIINCDQYCEIRFRMLKPLVDFVASLHKNHLDDRHLHRCCTTTIRGDEVIIRIEFPDEGQYGLDIYTRDGAQLPINGKQLLTHCCKYLINARVD